MDYMINMPQTEVAYWVAFLKDINKKESGMPKPAGKAFKRQETHDGKCLWVDI